MAEISVNGSAVGNILQQLLIAPDILAGDGPSYQLCKTIYAYHPLGAKIAEAPIEAAQSQRRKIAVPVAPDEIVAQFEKQWLDDGCDAQIANVCILARVYGISSLGVMTDGVDPDVPLDFATVWKKRIGYSVFDPLNTAGSLVLNQDPNSIDFQKHAGIAVAGKAWARNRSVTIMNERPLYIEYTSSAFGFSGRSVYQRILLPLKSFVQTMITDDMVSKKAGLLIAMIKGAGSVVDNMMMKFAGIKRSLLKIAVVDNVLSVGSDDKIESLNLQNLDGAFGNSRTNILKNIATGAKMPAVMVENETLTEGFGEGTEDAKIISRYVGGVREWMNTVYAFVDKVQKRRAWNPEYFAIIQKKYPEEFGGREYEEVFREWEASFSAGWPPLLEEPESEKIKVEDVKFKAILAAVEILAPLLDPDNLADLIEWLADNLNEHKLLFGSPLVLDVSAIADFAQDKADKAAEMGEQANKGAQGVGVQERLDALDESLAKLGGPRLRLRTINNQAS